MYRTTWIRRISTSAVITTMASFGVTSMASAQTISNTGTGSTNRISSSVTDNCSVTNNNNVSSSNRNNQTATSGNTTVSGNTSAGASWSGWSEYDPAASQSNRVSYASWRAGVTDWVSQRASGNGWNSAETNLSWTPASSDWSGYDPLAWQSNGQSFGNWYNALQSYLNGNSAAWIMSWPADATGSGNFGGASSGNAINSNNANFTIAINNAASAAAGTNSCGKSNFTPPSATGGMGGGTWTPPAGGGAVLGASTTNGQGSVGGSYHPTASYGSSSYHAPASTPVAYTPPAVSGPAPTTPVTPPAGGSGGGLTGTISMTGTDSHNTISSTYTNNSSVTNNNNVSYSNSNTQTASTGNTTVTGNTSTGGAGSGDGTNANGSGGNVVLSN